MSIFISTAARAEYLRPHHVNKREKKVRNTNAKLDPPSRPQKKIREKKVRNTNAKLARPHH